MQREGDLEEYRRYEVSAQQEAAWRREFIDEQVRLLASEDVAPLHRLSTARASEAIPALIARAEQGDSYSRFWYAYTLWELSGRERHRTRAVREMPSDSLAARLLQRVSAAVLDWLSAAPDDLAEPALRTATRIWRSLVDGPIELTDAHRAQITPQTQQALRASTPEDYLRNYARDMLARVEVTGR